jgi:hypothetical protein
MNVRILAVLPILAGFLAVGATQAAPAATDELVAALRITQEPTADAGERDGGSEALDEQGTRPIVEEQTEVKGFMASLTGDQEVPAVDTDANASAGFRWNPETGELEFRLYVWDISNVFAAHVHCAAPGANGPVGITLFSGAAGSGRFAGPLAKGILTAPDAGNACGWVDLAAAVAAFEAGQAYVNVHTNDGVDPAGTGPGDFPGGEIRGQIAGA